MKKVVRIKLWGKVLLSAVVLAISLFVYKKTGIIGILAQSDRFYQVVCIMSWLWLFMGQIIVLAKIWED